MNVDQRYSLEKVKGPKLTLALFIHLMCLLECPADGKFEPASFSRKENARQLIGKANHSVRIVVIDQAKRHVHDRYLNTKLETDTRFKITDTCEFRVVHSQQRILLSLAPNIQLLNEIRQSDRTTEPRSLSTELI